MVEFCTMEITVSVNDMNALSMIICYNSQARTCEYRLASLNVPLIPLKHE